MSSRKPPGLLALPRELLDGIFQQFYPESSVDLSDPFDDLDTPQCCIRSIAADRAALARCARVCRHLYIPAVATLWREQLMDHVCMATLSEWTYGSVKWPAGDMWGLDVESDEDDDMNHDVAVGGAAGHYDYRYPYDYIPGPISAQDWARFQHYAPYIRVLRYASSRTIEPLVFTYLQQRAGDKPIFPNLQELIWMHATPELALMVSPSLKILRIPHDDGSSKAMLPSTLARTPTLEVLELGLVGHESFWTPLSAAFSNRERPLCPNLHTVHITESPRALTKAAFEALSKVERLAELTIDIVGMSSFFLDEWDAPSLTRSGSGTFASLKRLRIKGSAAGIAVVLRAVVAPRLSDVDLEAEKFPNEDSSTGVLVTGASAPALRVAFASLRRGNARTVRRLGLTFHGFNKPLFALSAPPASGSGASWPETTQPLLELPNVQDLTLVHPMENARMSPPAVLAAWPALRALSLPEFVLTPDALRSVARTCTTLEQLSANSLSPDFLEQLLPGDTAPLGGGSPPALRELHVYNALPSMDVADASRVASFLYALFPRLDAERCYVRYDSSHPHPSVHRGGWFDVVRELRSLQSARQRDECRAI